MNEVIFLVEEAPEGGYDSIGGDGIPGAVHKVYLRQVFRWQLVVSYPS